MTRPISNPTVNDDHRLIDDFLTGNRGAFEDLVRRYQDRLYNTMVHVTGSREDARDIVQDTFIQVYQKLGTFRRTSAFFTWLYRIAHNIAISQRRKRRPVASVERQREANGVEPADPGEGPDERMEQEERSVVVREALSTLHEDFRAVVVLREMEGYDYETIADILDLPIGTVRSRLHRGRSMLRERLKIVLHEES